MKRKRKHKPEAAHKELKFEAVNLPKRRVILNHHRIGSKKINWLNSKIGSNFKSGLNRNSCSKFNGNSLVDKQNDSCNSIPLTYCASIETFYSNIGCDLKLNFDRYSIRQRARGPNGRLLLILFMLLSQWNIFTCAFNGEIPNDNNENVEQLINSSNESNFIRANKFQQQLPDSNSSVSNEILLQTESHGIFKGLLLPAADGTNFERGFVGFFGIRYASAPVKRLRFMPPTAFNYKANQVHDFRRFGPICHQLWPIDFNLKAFANETLAANIDLQMNLMRRIMSNSSYEFYRPLIKQLLLNFHQSEDCLNLNVYAPIKDIKANGIRLTSKVMGTKFSIDTGPQSKATNDDNLLPVLVLIHGDSFDFGSGSTLDGSKLLRRERELLVVTLNYRLNILGASRGNLGLMDQIAALHWLRDNIRLFGGSERNITLMGVRRGAIMVNLLMLSPLAKGLFHRAILEDGSALSPLIANQISATQTAKTLNQNKPNIATHPAIKSIRALATLADCWPTGQASGNSSLLEWLDSVESKRSNAIMFECLRTKPIEQITQRIPLNLFKQQQSGHFSHEQLKIDEQLLSKHPKLFEYFSPLNKSLSIYQFNEQSTVIMNNNHSLSNGEAGSFTNLGQLESFIAHFTKPLYELLMRENVSESSASELELFDRIYSVEGRQEQSILPLFQPIVDGTIVPGEDLAQSMLKDGSGDLHQKDLLIGLSQAIFDMESEKIGSVGQQSPPQSVTNDSLPARENNLQGVVRFNNLMANWVTQRREQVGLSNEQAVDLVNLFVKSFYQHHNQEITNSIINNYLSNKQFRLRKWKSSPSWSATENQEALVKSVDEEKQLIVLEALFEAFQDVLVNSPLIKTALIHSIKQVNKLVDVFVGQQFEKWKLKFQEQNNFNRNLISEREILLNSFISFARALFNDPNWPLELHHKSASINNGLLLDRDLLQPKATYLYQLNLPNFLKQLTLKLDKEIIRSPEYNLIGKNFRQLLSKIQRADYLSRLSSSNCAFDSTIEFMLKENEAFGDDADFLLKFSDWVCSKFSRIVANFVKLGNLNRRIDRDENQMKASPTFEARFTQFKSKCSDEFAPAAVAVARLDHHSLYATSAATSQNNSSSFEAVQCKMELNSLTFDYIIKGFHNSTTEAIPWPTKHWPIFNPFDQQFVTLPGELVIPGESEFNWQESQLSEAENSFLDRSLFWSNYISSYNCSKTQPINPLTLLNNQLSASASKSMNSLNSTLLNLNLLFNCHQPSSNNLKSAHDMIEALAISIRSQLQAKVGQFVAANARNAPQNHHSLRMAHMNQSGSIEMESDSQQQRQHSQEIVGNSNEPSLSLNNSLENASLPIVDSNNFEPDQGSGFKTALGDSRRNQRHMIALLVLCGLVLSATLILAIFSIANRLRRKQKPKRVGKCEKNENSPPMEAKSLSGDRVECRELEVELNRPDHPVAVVDDGPAERRRDPFARLEAFKENHVYTINEQVIGNGNTNQSTTRGDGLDFGVAPLEEPIAQYQVNDLIATNLCPSHSSLSLSNDNSTTIIEKLPNHLENLELLGQRYNSANILNQTFSQHFNCDSSNETTTQNQSSSLSANYYGAQSTMRKKRVQISDNPPRRISSSATGAANNFPTSSRANNKKQMQQFCPIHHNQQLSNSSTALFDPNPYYMNCGGQSNETNLTVHHSRPLGDVFSSSGQNLSDLAAPESDSIDQRQLMLLYQNGYIQDGIIFDQFVNN